MAIKTKPTGPLNYTALAEHLAAETGTSVDTAKATVTALLDIVARTVADGHPARAARNPQTGETMHLPASRAVRFRVSPRLADIIRAGDTAATVRKRPKSA
ncbi:HU family DNA-binding protein [Streptomyces rimosus]|uniref:HU family DNA-binding protein n=1 Tax=Streptomyces rimosus TaxID=1927 RepID=UPI0004C9B716|nr:HU family DNA-binding protein [Streptomyces rimosus]